MSPLVLALAIAGIAPFPAGCSSPPDADANRPLEGDLPGATSNVTPARIDAIHAAFDQLPPPGYVAPSSPPRTGLRWSDLQAAVAASLLDNDAALLRSTIGDDHAEFRFITTSAIPGTVVATRLEGPELVKVVATIESTQPDAKREAAIAAGVHRKLAALGKRRQLADS